MIRSTLIVVFTLAATGASAVPIANFSPQTGQIVFTELGFRGELVIVSSAMQLLPANQYQLPGQPTPIVVDTGGLPGELIWQSTQVPFPNLVNVGFVTQPLDLVADLAFTYRVWDGSTFGPSQDGIVFPEPSALVLASLGGVAVMRRRPWQG